MELGAGKFEDLHISQKSDPAREARKFIQEHGIAAKEAKGLEESIKRKQAEMR